MQKLHQKTVLITGASSGIGKATAEQFAAAGARLILTARRKNRLEELAQMLAAKYKIDIHIMALDVQNKQQVTDLAQTLPENWRAIDILVNNAGLALASDKIQDGLLENWDTMIDTNVRGLLYVTRTLLPNMIKRNQGHIINIGSVAGLDVYPTGNVYCATKHAVKAISQALRVDLLGTAIRVTEIDPGAVNTEFSEVRWKDKNRADAFYADFKSLVADDIADAILYCATRPAHVNISQLVIYPVDQASVHQIHKAGTVAKTLFDK